jgi:hypothetical protein
MNKHTEIFQDCADRARRALAPHCFDGSELHQKVNAELRGIEYGPTAINIRSAIEEQYRGALPLDVAVEIVAGLLEDGERA